MLWIARVNLEVGKLDNKMLKPFTELKWYEAPEQVEEQPENEPQAQTEAAKLLVMKAALMETTASRGWKYVERFAETVVRDLERKALDEDDDAKAAGMRRDARGARKFKDDLFERINMARNMETKSHFVEVVTE
jgi:hypothetical protein